MSKSLLIEFLSEEIPSDLQTGAAEQLAKNIGEALQASKIGFGEAKCFSTPRRIAVLFADVAEESEAVDEEIKGPKKSAPEQAKEGFFKKYNLTENDCVVKDNKGELTYFYINRKPAEKTASLLEIMVSKALHHQSWKTSMRFGSQEFTWIRPIRSILVMLGDEVVKGSLDLGDGESLKFADGTFGHTRLHPESVKLKSADEYEKTLEAKSVIADAEKRKQMIVDELNKLKSKWQEDERLLQEVNGLVEYPYFATGNIDKKFLELPAEVLATAMISHQKYFPLFDGENPAPVFAFVANIPANEEVIKGNEKVLRARLQDAVFLFEEDLETPLKDRIEDLKNLNYFEGLGTMYDKTKRLEKLADYIAKHFNIREERAVETASLLKADLTTEMVGEFPELQGIMGGVYANSQYGSDTVQAIRNHYEITDQAPLSQAMSLIDRIDHLVGFWLIDKKPTGSKDPFALRRTAIGILGIVFLGTATGEIGKKSPTIGLYDLFEASCKTYGDKVDNEVIESLIQFCYERYRIILTEDGVPYDILDAIFNEINYYEHTFLLVARWQCLEAFLKTSEAPETVAAYKRIANILKAEDSKTGTIEEGLLKEDAEKELWQACQIVLSDEKIMVDEFLPKLASLVKPINNFFDNVMVNDDDKKIRQNRLNLLKTIYSKAELIGDFSKLVDRT